MKHKLIAAGLITALLCTIAGNSVACTTEVVEYHLTISSTEGGDVTKPGEGRFTYCPQQGVGVALVAVPYPGYQFVNWTGNVNTITDVNAAVTTITVNGDYSITANFAKPYSLTISSTEGGSVTTPGEGTFVYHEGDVVKLVATPDPGYGFVNWTGDVNTITNVNAASTSITMNGDYSLAANFEELAEYDLTTSSTTGGSVTAPGEGVFKYYDGTVVNLVATENGGYYFINWTGDVGTISNIDAPTTTIAMNDNYSITANFRRIPLGKVALTTSSTVGGSVTIPGEGAFIYDGGTVVDLVAEAQDGYRFVNWTGNVGAIANVNSASTTITVNDNYSITANFKHIPTGKVALTTSSTAGGSVTAPGEGAFTYDAGAVVDLVAEAEEGYRFVNWTGDVGTVANVSAPSTTITMDDDYSITANFVKLVEQYYLTISSTDGGSVTIPGEGIFAFDEGTLVNLVAKADTGYWFMNWTGDVSTVANVNAATTTITMNGDYTIAAHFVDP